MQVKVMSVVLLSAALSPQARPKAALNARQIVEENQKRTVSSSERYQGQLQSFTASGQTSEKRWTVRRLGSHGHSKTVIRFTAPAEVKGVALLVHNHPDRSSDQWMWTPAIERDRRIAQQDRSTRFFGTDFSFEDLEERDVAQYDYVLLGEEGLSSVACWKIQSIPKQSKLSQYTKSVIWIRKDNYAIARIDLYVDREVVRRLEYSDIRNIQGVWTARKTVMKDLRRGGVTSLTLDQIEYNVALNDSEFTLQALRRP